MSLPKTPVSATLRSLLLAVLAAGIVTLPLPTRADEGMWTLDNLPLRQMKARYNFTPSAEWIKRVTQSSARLAAGCSASFVSGDGLVMTNHHCANACLSSLSTPGQDLMRNGYSASSPAKEPRCPAMELDRLDHITDISARMKAALAGKQGQAFNDAQRSAQSAIETECTHGDATTWRCDVVSLYRGGRTALYRYRRYQDVRLVFAPEQSIAFFGGDPDNFNFPRTDLDVTFLRAYDAGRPVHTSFFPFDPAGPQQGQLVFTSGNPGSTARETTVGELTVLRDVELPATLSYFATLDGALWQYGRAGSVEQQDAGARLFSTRNSLKAYGGWLAALNDAGVIDAKQHQEASLRHWINATPKRRRQFGDPWATLVPAIEAERTLYTRYIMLDGGTRTPRGLQGDLFSYARLLVRGAAERAKPDAQRLADFHDSRLPAIVARLAVNTPLHPQLEQLLIAFSLGKLQQNLGADDPAVMRLLDRQSPEQIATRLVSFTQLTDPKVRLALWRGGTAAIAASKDPVIVLMREAETIARPVRDQWENQVTAPEQQASAALAQARFARDGNAIYPDATFTQRLSFGVVDGWHENGKTVPAFTHFSGLYDRATGSEPFALSKSWLDARPRLDLDTNFDFVSTNDVIGGNSGSPVIDTMGRAVGLIFDGNIHSLGGNFTYDGALNRAVSLDTSALIAALGIVYRDQGLVQELTNGHR